MRDKAKQVGDLNPSKAGTSREASAKRTTPWTHLVALMLWETRGPRALT